MTAAYAIGRLMPDKLFLTLKYYQKFGNWINWKNPQTFNEKLQWLKIYDRNPLYTTMVDKYAVKDYVSNIIGDEYIIPTLGVWYHFDDINFDELPDQFVLKCTHDSGGLVIVKDKSKLDIDVARRKIEDSLKTDYYMVGREWPYKNVKPRIIAEKYMVDQFENELMDYKFFCFDGKVKCSYVCTDRFTESGLKCTFYNREWEKMQIEHGYPKSDAEIHKPLKYDEMLDIAEKLSKNIPFLRVDFYEIQEKIYLGELTFYPQCGFGKFEPSGWDKKLGEWIKLLGGYLLNTGKYVLFLYQAEKKTISNSLTDYKFYCFNGYVDCVMVCGERETGQPKYYFFDKEWNLLRINVMGKEAPEDFTLPKPSCMDEMFAIASKLSQDIPFVRVDLYACNEQVYFGEMTFFPSSGFGKNYLPEAEEYFGSLIQL